MTDKIQQENIRFGVFSALITDIDVYCIDKGDMITMIWMEPGDPATRPPGAFTDKFEFTIKKSAFKEIVQSMAMYDELFNS